MESGDATHSDDIVNTSASSNQNNSNESDSNDNAMETESRGAKPKVRLMNIPNGLNHAPKLNNNTLIRHGDTDQLINDPYISQDNVDCKAKVDKCQPSKVQCTKCITCSNLHESNLYYEQNSFQQICDSNIKVNNITNLLENGCLCTFEPVDKETENKLVTSSNRVSEFKRQDSNAFTQQENSHCGYEASNMPSSSGMNIPPSLNKGTCVDNTNNVKKPSKYQKRSVDPDDSSDTGNDEASLGSDDCCIYTYRGGDHLVDLPNSFFGMPMAAPALENRVFNSMNEPPRAEPLIERPNSGSSSPKIDYLEMDFDPGPSCEAGSTDEASTDLEFDIHEDDLNEFPQPEHAEDLDRRSREDSNITNNDINHPEVGLNILQNIETDIRNNLSMPGPSNSQKNDLNNAPSSSAISDNNISVPVASTSNVITPPGPVLKLRPDNIAGPSSVGWVGQGSNGVCYFQRTCSTWPTRECPGHLNSGDLVSPREFELNKPEDVNAASAWAEARNTDSKSYSSHSLNLSSALFHCTMAKRLMHSKSVAPENDSSNVEGMISSFETLPIPLPSVVPKTMVWSEQEAISKQVTQISTSACGATAVINVLIALNLPVDIDKVKQSVNTRLRLNDALIPKYLLSRSKAGCSHIDIIRALDTVSDGNVFTKFFPMFPERIVCLSYWLSHWISNGCVPIVTINLQVGTCSSTDIPDAWHHQMVFGVGPRGVYLTNPLQCVHEGALWPQLCSDSILMVRATDLLSRWNKDTTDLRELITIRDKRWHRMNVLGQVVNVIRESQSCQGQGRTRTTHIRIPAVYKAGVTIVALKNSKAAEELANCGDLPCLPGQQ